MTIEEIEIIVTAKVEEALKEFQKMSPALKQVMKQAEEAFSKVDMKKMTNKLHQAVNFMKKKMQDLKKSSENNEIAIKVNNKDAQKQISQLQRQIDSLQEKINARRIKLDIITPKLDKIANEPMNKVNPGRLENNKQYINLSDKEQMATKEIAYYSKQLTEAKNKMAKLKSQTEQTATTQKKLSSFFGGFKQKVDQIKPSISGVKNIFSKMPGIGQSLSKTTQNVTGHIKNMSSGVKSGLGHVLKYAGALFSLQGIYSVLSGCAQSWLSSQNAGAKQLSANIEYMKYAMGSALAPIIKFVTNLVYQLMKAIQSVVYALTGVNIFAKASAKSYSAMAGSAKKAKEETKQLAGVHDEINNIQSDNNADSGSEGTTSPSFDLSQMDNVSNNIIDAIKNGNWYEIGSIIGEKLNDAMNSIPWDKIQDTAKKIGTNIAQFLNGFIATTDWNQVGNTFAQGLNTIIYFGYSFITTFNWKQFGKAIGDAINGFFNNVDWAVAAKTLSEGIKGIFNTITGFFETFDWSILVDGLLDFISEFDWNGVLGAIFEALGTACASLVNLGMVIGEKINEALEWSKEWWKKEIEDCGGNIVLGVLKGIIDQMLMIGQWIYDNIFAPFIEGFKSAFGIHSPSTVMAELGNFIMQGLLNGITSLVDNVKQIWENIKNTAIQIFNDIKNSISNIWQQVTGKTSETWQNIKNKVKEGAQGAWNGITSVFNNIPDWFKNKFSQAWQAVKNVFSTGGRIFDGIKEGILSGLKSIVNAIISGINKVISIPFNGLNSALKTIRSAEIMGLRPFSWIGTISVPQIPRLARGGVLTEATTVLAGEYSGAKSNPEIVTPQNIMRDTFEDVLSEFNSNNGQPVHVTIQYLGKEIFDDVIDHINSRTRRTGKNTIVMVGD